jgi:hypothetical protein
MEIMVIIIVVIETIKNKRELLILPITIILAASIGRVERVSDIPS